MRLIVLLHVLMVCYCYKQYILFADIIHIKTNGLQALDFSFISRAWKMIHQTSIIWYIFPACLLLVLVWIIYLIDMVGSTNREVYTMLNMKI